DGARGPGGALSADRRRALRLRHATAGRRHPAFLKALMPWLGVTGVVALAVTLVVLTLRPTDVPAYAPTPPAPRAVGSSLVGPVLYTVDATAPDAWRHFSFRLGSVVDTPADLAFRRYAIVAGPGAGILDLGERRLDEIRTAPADGYQANEGQADP